MRFLLSIGASSDVHRVRADLRRISETSAGGVYPEALSNGAFPSPREAYLGPEGRVAVNKDAAFGLLVRT